MKLKKMLAGHLLVLGLIFPHAVSAEDFTFNVEVEISNLHPDVNQLRVFCEVEGITLVDSFKTINVPAAGGSINTTVQVKINAADEMPALSDGAINQRGFACFLQGSKTGGSFESFMLSNSAQCNSANEWRCARTGTPSTIRLGGTFDVYTE